MSITLAEARPDLVAELVNKSDASMYTGSQKKIRWCCNKGHIWTAKVAARVRGSGCPYCSGRLAIPGETDLATLRPDLAAELVDKSLATVLRPGGHQQIEWECSNGHRYVNTPNARSGGRGCPYCSNKKILLGYNDLATVRPDLAAELVDKSLSHQLFEFSNKSVLWCCAKGHVWKATVANRSRGSGCPYCAGKKVSVGETDLLTVRPDLAAQLVDKSLATKLLLGGSQKVEWQCAKGHRWFASAHSRKAGYGCPYCAGNKVFVGETDLATTHPEMVLQLVNPEDAKTVSAGSGQKLMWKCENGHTWKATVAGRVNGSGCPICARDKRSSLERELVDVVKALVGNDIKVWENNRTIIAPQELDIVVPSKHIAIELNGTYWHSDTCNVNRNYHKNKRLACNKAGYQLIFVWEDEWRDKRDIVVRALAAKLGCVNRLSNVGINTIYTHRLFARKLICSRIDSKTAREFLEKNHIQGAVTATAHFALLENGVCRAVLSVRSPRNNARMKRAVGEWEVQRYATSCQVIGGFSRLLLYAQRELLKDGHTINKWISFSSCDVSDGGMYKACGFVQDRELPPDYKYAGNFTGGRRVPKESFQKKRFRADEKLLWNEMWTEREAAEANGLGRCWDSGKYRWVKVV